MMERMQSVPPRTGKYRPEQLAYMGSWDKIADDTRKLANMKTIQMVPENASTCTYVNALDPGDGQAWYNSPNDWGAVHSAGR